MFLQLVQYLDENSIIHPNHYGSRKGHSTSTATALIQMYDSWVNAVEEGEMAGVMMIDLSAAFDMVDHGILLETLKLLGHESEAVKWMESYLCGRSQCVCVDGCLSSSLDIDCGVPQGSVLGPLMYILFTNDLPDVIHTQHEQPLSYKQPCMHCNPYGLVNYVDDGTYSFTHKDPNLMSEVLTHKYKIIEEYMVSNKLVINADKTYLVMMGTRKMEVAISTVKLIAGQHTILSSATEKFLGFSLNQSPKWQTHIHSF